MLVKNAPDMDTPEAKLNWIFEAYDTDGGGRWQYLNYINGLIICHVLSIDVVEIMDLVVGLFKMSKMEEDMDRIVACVHEIRSSIDGDGDGDISKEEFVNNAMNSKFLYNMLNQTGD
jgi:Ca2+-binding EF-hand superfamily protein